MNKEEILNYGRKVLAVEAEVLKNVALDDNFTSAVELLLSCEGRVVLSGVGKPGLIAAKISATMASTGTPSITLHPTEAVHGDLGRIDGQDVFLALSNSGETEELLRVLPVVRNIGAKVICMTAQANSSLAKHSDIVICYGAIEEACPLGMAPSTSTTVMLALGDALALTVSKAKNFSQEDFARFHPGGKLGLQLMQVKDLMRSEERLCLLKPDGLVSEALIEISRCRSGAAVVVDDEGKLLGIFTDGDLRRSIETGQAQGLAGKIADVMTQDPIHISENELLTAAIPVMKSKHINQLPVLNDEGKVSGLLDVQDFLDINLL